MIFVHSWKNPGVFPVGLSKRGLITVQQAISNIKGPQVKTNNKSGGSFEKNKDIALPMSIIYKIQST